MRVTNENGSLVIFCDDCGSRVAWIKADCIVLRHKHHGQVHTTVLPITELLKLGKAEDIRGRIRTLS